MAQGAATARSTDVRLLGGATRVVVAAPVAKAVMDNFLEACFWISCITSRGNENAGCLKVFDVFGFCFRDHLDNSLGCSQLLQSL